MAAVNVYDHTGQETDVETTSEKNISDWFKNITAILIALVAFAGAVVAWRAAVADGAAGDNDFAGSQAAINGAETHILNTTTMYTAYRAYADFTKYRHLQQLLQEQPEVETDDELGYEWAIASQLASDNEFYFSKRYLDQDGSYNSRRHLAEAWAEAGQQLDLDPVPHFASADQLRSKASSLISLFIVQGVALLCYTVAEGLHPTRRWLRYLMATSGTIFLVFSIAAAVIVERS